MVIRKNKKMHTILLTEIPKSKQNFDIHRPIELTKN